LNDEEKIRAVKRRHSARLLSQRGVSGVGVEKDEAGRFVLAVHINADDPKIAQQLPSEIEGCPVKIIKSGPFHKQATEESAG